MITWRSRNPSFYLDMNVPIPITCDCGKRFRVKDESAGRKVRCPACKSVLTVPAPNNAEDEALDVLLREDAPPAKPRPREPDLQDQDQSDEKEEHYSAKPMSETKPAPPAKKPHDPGRGLSLPRKPEREQRSLGFVVSPTIITGLLMMVGAAVWFAIGLAIGLIYIYPPILFVLGVAAVARGCMGHED
jgi:hypothetical protein